MRFWINRAPKIYKSQRDAHNCIGFGSGIATHTKTHLGRSPKVCSVFGVQYYLFALASSQVAALTVAELTAQCNPQPRVTLVNTSVYLKPTKLLNVALDVLARLAPCLNLGVRELGHKDLLDTIGADNCRK